MALRAALRSRRHLRACRKRCRHCRIFFLTHPRNQSRQDLRCPFGCRDAHRAGRSAERSAAYYRTAAGKTKKKALNGRRGPPRDAGTGEEDRTGGGRPEERSFDAGIVEHVRVVTGLIEGFVVSREEVLAMLQRAVRQRRIARERRIDYLLRWLEEDPASQGGP